MKESTNLTFLLLVGLAGTIITGIGEFLLHFNTAGYESEIEMVRNVPLDRAGKGHFMVVFGAPLYFAGYYAIYRMVESANKRLAQAFFIAGVFSFAVGGVWVASRYFIAVVLQQSAGTDDYAVYLSNYEEYYQSLVWALRILVLAVSAFWIALIVSGKTIFPKWMVIVSPVLLLAMVFGLYAGLPAIGTYLVPTAMNVAHLIFFSVVLIQFRKWKTNGVA